MVEKVEKMRTTLADLFAAEPLSSSDTGEKIYPNVAIVAETPTSRPASCMGKVHQKEPARKPPNATRKLSRVCFRRLLSYVLQLCSVHGNIDNILPDPVPNFINTGLDINPHSSSAHIRVRNLNMINSL
jgi:hypothetical protein